MTSSLTGSRIEVHVSRQPIRWGDMDALGHVNNTCYFRYMEQARIEWLFALGARLGSGYAEGSGPVIVNASCTFLAPLTYPADIEVRMYLEAPGRTSIGSVYEIVLEGRMMAQGAAKIVWVEVATGRPTPLPRSVLEVFEREGGR